MFRRCWEVRPYGCETGFASVVLTWENWAGGTGEWAFLVGGNNGATGFGWRSRIAAAPGSDLHLALRAALDGKMPPEILADRLEDEGKYAAEAAWLRNPDLRPA